MGRLSVLLVLAIALRYFICGTMPKQPGIEMITHNLPRDGNRTADGALRLTAEKP